MWSTSRAVRFFEEEHGLILHMGLPSGKWIKVSPGEAREITQFRRKRSATSMRKVLASQLESSSEDTLDSEAAFKAFKLTELPPPLTGANAVPVTSTPVRPSGSESQSTSVGGQDKEMRQQEA